MLERWFYRGRHIFTKLLKSVSLVCTSATVACAEWDPLILSTDFDGIRGDLLTTAGGMVAGLLIIVGLGLLVKAFIR